MRTNAALSLIALLGLGCHAPELDAPDPASGSAGKGEAINQHNDPVKLGFPIKFKLADASMVGVTLESDLDPYAAPSYYPFTSDGINNRYGSDPSPAEKYDLAFSGWQPPEGFFELDRLDGTSDTTFDQAYYDQLGPVATWEHINHGLGPLHDGVDNDRNDKTDLDDPNHDGLEGWFGYCNGNTAASISVPGPAHAVTHNGVEFSANDIKALLAAVYYDDRSTMTGLRCSASSLRTDRYGRPVDQPWYRELRDNGSGPVVNFIVTDGPFYADEDRTMVGYQVVVNQDGRLDQAMIRLTLEEFMAYNKDPQDGQLRLDGVEGWTQIEFSTATDGCRDTNPATLYLAVTHLLGTYKVPFAIDADEGSHVWNYPISAAVIETQELIDREQANELLELAAGQQYPFNAEATQFAHVKLALKRSHSMSLEMVLELDDEDNVIGGEWVGYSRRSHPDFIWVAMGADSTGFNTDGTYVTFGDDQLDGARRNDGSIAFNDAPDMRYSDVRLLLAKSRTGDNAKLFEIEGDGADVLTEGETTELEVTFEEADYTKVDEALVYLDITAEQPAGLKLELVAADGTVVKLFDVPADIAELAPGRQPVGIDLGSIRGVAHPMPLVDAEGQVKMGLKQLVDTNPQGSWKLRVTNEAAGQARLAHWALWLTAVKVAPPDPDPDPEPEPEPVPDPEPDPEPEPE